MLLVTTVLSYGVVVGEGIIVPDFTRISLLKRLIVVRTVHAPVRVVYDFVYSQYMYQAIVSDYSLYLPPALPPSLLPSLPLFYPPSLLSSLSRFLALP